jgi:hypothetical protein
MDGLPDIHDGYFDGLCVSSQKSVHLFLRTETSEPSTIVLKGVEAMNVSNFLAGNIILDIVVVGSEKVTIGDIEQLYQLQPTQAEMAERLFRKAQQQGLSVLYITPSYGAECSVLFQAAEILPNHVLPEQTPPAST